MRKIVLLLGVIGLVCSDASKAAAQAGTPTASPSSIRNLRVPIELLSLPLPEPAATSSDDPCSHPPGDAAEALASFTPPPACGLVERWLAKHKVEDAALKSRAAKVLVASENESVDARLIAEFGKAQAENLESILARDGAAPQQQTVILASRNASGGAKPKIAAPCAVPDGLIREFRRSAIELSLADADPKWRDAVVRLQTALGRLQSAARESRLQDCHLSPSAVAETEHIETHAVAKGALLQAALETPFAPKYPHSHDATSILSALTVAQTKDAKQVALSPVDYFFSNRWRLYVRSTLTLDDEEEEAAGDVDAATAEPAPEDLGESVKLALLDPFGGGLNISGGYYGKIPTPFLSGDANDLGHGLFIDARAGLKFVELPEEKLKLVDGETRNTPFYQIATALRLLLPVWKSAPGTDSAGGVEIALTGSWNRIADISASDLFASTDGAEPFLRPNIRNVHLAIKLDLKEVANIQVSGTLWSDSKFDRRFVIGFGVSTSQLRGAEQESNPTAPGSDDAATANKSR